MNPRIEKPTKSIRDRKSERGAALVTVMMISFLLLVASIALILESTMNTANVTDATSEEQARNILREQKFEDAYNEWLRDLRGRAYIEMREPPS